MLIKTCKVCDCGLDKEPLLRLEGMPASAQNLPDAVSLFKDTGLDLEVYQCFGCGLVQLGNDPVSYYKEVIRASAFSAEMKQFRINQFEDFVEKYDLKNKKVVEIGCGKGEYLSLMKQCGVNAYGIEYSRQSVDFCNSHGLKVDKFYIDTEYDRLKDAPYDAFFIMNFFEHVPNPNSILRALYKNLSEDGMGLIEVPNFDMILENNLFSEFISDHLFYFTRETLELTLKRCGFEIIECKEIWYNYIISAVVRKRKKLNLSEFKEHRAKIKKELQEFIDLYDGKVAVYGASHQALAIIALTDIGAKISYVVDDAPFKQNKFTPASHVPINSSDYLNMNPVDAIIVMAASYSDEVANKIRKNLNLDVDLVILRDFGLEKIE